MRARARALGCVGVVGNVEFEAGGRKWAGYAIGGWIRVTGTAMGGGEVADSAFWVAMESWSFGRDGTWSFVYGDLELSVM